jgi:trehalose/maltose hydrolase-like predicted phosphorylase
LAASRTASGARRGISPATRPLAAPEPPAGGAAGWSSDRDGWSLVYEGFDLERERVRESLCALGNGYFATRGAAPWASADGARYPGVYLAGGYNRLRTRIGEQVVENEDLANLPNWLALHLRLDGPDWFEERKVRLLSCRQELDLRRGVLERTIAFEDRRGRRSTLNERRLVSMADMHTAALELSLTAENWSGVVGIRSAVDGRVLNTGARLYDKFNNRHLQPVGCEPLGEDGVLLLVRTSQSNLQVAQAARTRLFRDGEAVACARRLLSERSYIGQEFEAPIEAGQTLRIEKLAVLYTSRDAAISEPAAAARKGLERQGSFEAALSRHAMAWEHLWRRFDVRLLLTHTAFDTGFPMLVRLNMFHLLQAASPNSIGLDAGIPARGWTGEAYQGHIFWDELFILPTLTFRLPEIARSLLMYRYRRLDEARAAAAEAGYRGAMFPWQSGSDGQEETQELNLNPRSQRWVPDNSFRQRHVGAAIAWTAWQYLQVTDDREFLQFFGAELILEIARFWASSAALDEEKGRYVIRGVMGPDEFHEAYPGSHAFGIDNNAYTNVMAVWVLWRGLDVLGLLPDERREEIRARLGLSAEETDRWEDITRRMFVPFHDGVIISQFEGYERLAELDWDAYRARYGDIQRLELILEAEGDSANRYKLCKQADTLMLFYLFSAEELEALFSRMGYRLEEGTIPRNVAYYSARCSHGSTLSRVVHAWVLARSDREQALRYFAEALQSDVNDIQGGTAAEGVHLGAMAGTVDLVQRVCTGIETTGGVLRFNPELPHGLDRLNMRIRYRGHALNLELTREALRIRGQPTQAPPIRVALGSEEVLLPAGGERSFEVRA